MGAPLARGLRVIRGKGIRLNCPMSRDQRCLAWKHEQITWILRETAHVLLLCRYHWQYLLFNRSDCRIFRNQLTKLAKQGSITAHRLHAARHTRCHYNNSDRISNGPFLHPEEQTHDQLQYLVIGKYGSLHPLLLHWTDLCVEKAI